MNERPYLQKIILDKNSIKNFDEYPLCIDSIRNFDCLDFHSDVTFFVGENGSGKSTLLEAIANIFTLNPEGGNKNTRFSTNKTDSNLYKYLKNSKSHKRPKDWYFLRAESFYNLSSYVDDMGNLSSYGGNSLHNQSHGESFLSILEHKLNGYGLYLFDEIESALSPMRQLTCISLIHNLVKRNSQFIIATHSPILLAYPNAKIYQFSKEGIKEVSYEETEHYKITKDFLNQYEKMTHILTQN